MKVKRVVVITDLSESAGGQEVLAMLSARLLKERGLEVIYVCGDHGASAALKALDIEICPAGLSRLLELPSHQALRRGLYDPETRDFIKAVVNRYDSPGTVFHVHSWPQIFSPSIFSALAPVAHRCFLHAHDMVLACPNGVYLDFRTSAPCARRPLSLSCIATNCDKRNYAQKLWRVARQTVLSRCLDLSEGWGGVIVIHPEMVPMLQRFGYPESIFHLVRNPVRPFTPERVTVEENNALLYVGRLEPEKGVPELAHAARRVGMPLVCVGDGSLRDWLAGDFPEVTLTGWLDQKEIAQWAAKARALVMPTRMPEPFGLVLAEAIHSGIPVAVTRIALMANEIEKAGLGLTFDVNDPASLDGALAAIRDMPPADLSEMSRLGHSGPLRLGLSEEAWVDGLVELYERALG